jgi:hypothetical protein
MQVMPLFGQVLGCSESSQEQAVVVPMTSHDSGWIPSLQTLVVEET